MNIKLRDFVSHNRIFIIILLMGTALFYWFQIRPSGIRQKCYNSILEKRDERINTNDRLTNSGANNYYRRCFAENGLKPEDLVK